MENIEKKKGLSKGCIVGIVIVGVVVVLVVVGGFLCYANKDALIKMGMTTVVNGVKSQLAEAPVEGVETETFNAVADEFLKKLEAEEELSQEKMANFGAQMKAMSSNMDNLSTADVTNFMNAMIEYYPDLKDLIPADAPAEEAIGDSTVEGTEGAVTNE